MTKVWVKENDLSSGQHSTNENVRFKTLKLNNLLEYSDNYSITSGSLRRYYRDEVNDDANENNAARITTTKQ